MESHHNVHEERRALFMVSVPGLNDWAVEAERKLCGSIPTAVVNANEVSNGVKRSLAEVSEPIDEREPDAMSPKKPATDTPSGSSSNDAGTNGLSREYLLNSPIADRPSKACMVKFYENFADITLNSVLDVVGFLSVDPSLCGSLQSSDELLDNFQELCAMNPPPSLIPRIHVIAARPVNNLNPMLDETVAPLTIEQTRDIYKDLKLVLTQCLFGDEIAAEYLLCHLMSTVYVRADETLGQFSLNITNIPAETLPSYTKQLYEIIESILPASHYLPITLDNLNNLEFVPK